MGPIQVNPKAIKAGVKSKSVVTPTAKFSAALDAASAMGPAAAELVSQWTGGNQTAGAILNAAFSGIQTAGAASAMGGSYGLGGFGPYTSTPGVMGVGSYNTHSGFISGKTTELPTSNIPGFGGTSSVDDPAQYQHELMQTMNANNLKLLELQALMQSNMQAWTTKSNILSADHRARMSMIEKFTARG